MREDSSLSLFGRITSELVGKLPMASSQTGLVTDAGIFVLQIEIGCLQYQRQQQNGGENKSHRQVIAQSGETGDKAYARRWTWSRCIKDSGRFCNQLVDLVVQVCNE
jgi:hypothetical protein